MIKHKLICKYGITKYVIKSRKGDQIDEMAVQKIRSREVPGLLIVEVNRKKKSFQLIYDVTGFMKFRDFLQQPVTKDIFLSVIRGIVHAFTEVSNHHLEIAKINFDMDSIFVNPADNHLFFIYVPICDLNNGVTLKEMLQAVPAHCVFSATENNEYVSAFMQFVNEHANISKVELNQLLNSLEGNVSIHVNPATKTCPHCGSTVPADSAFCVTCGKNLEQSVNNKKENTYDPINGVDIPPERRGKTSSDSESQPMKEWKVSKGTTVLGSNSYGNNGGNQTTILTNQIYPYLIRKYTGEKIEVNCSPFRIGKEQCQCNYYVPDNSAVSRNHADIFSENGRYYIQDNGSTNYTYLDGRRITQYEKYEIFSDMQIRLANEDFTFVIEEGGR